MLRKKKQKAEKAAQPNIKLKMNKDISSLPPIAVIGAGSWGTALAIHLAQNKQTVRLWDHDPKHIHAMQKTRCNARYLPNVAFPKSLKLYTDLAEAVSNLEDILLVVPSHAFRNILQSLKPLITAKTRIAWGTKGIDPASHQLLHHIAEEILGKRSLAVLSGPSFAAEVAKGLPTAVSVASNSKNFASDLVHRFNHKMFRVYTSNDLIGVQLGGAVKNVIAIAVGVSDGLGYGANARSALITRGLAEIMRLGRAMGAKQNTFFGLSGIGDLILTCTDNQSRNRRLGLAIAGGADLKSAEKTIGQVVEGVHTAAQVMFLAEKHQVDLPICKQVNRIIRNEVSLETAVIELLSRQPKPEFN